MNLPRHEIEARLAHIRNAIDQGLTVKETATRLKVQLNNLRDLMGRHGIALPPSWVPRKHKRHAPRLADGQPFLSDQYADPASLPDEILDAAEQYRIPPGRAAWLVSCEKGGFAYGLKVMR